MNQQNINIDIELIARYLSAEATPEEIDRIESWLAASDDNKKLYEEYRSVWNEMEKLGPVAGLDLDAEWKYQESLMVASEQKVPFTRESPRSALFMVSRLAVAAVVVVAMVLGGLYVSRNIGSVTIATLNESEEITLPDGSIVTLNNNSELVYPKRFKDGARNVNLVGEGFFEVKENPEWPFVIDTREVDIRVLGTSFNVNAYVENEEIEVTVRTGQVAVTRRGEVPKTIILKPGSKAVYNKAEEDLSLSTSIDKNYLAWKTRSFIFEDQPLAEVASALNKVYNSEISIPSDSLKSARITTTFNDQTLDAILNVLAATLDIEVVEYEGKILLKESNQIPMP